MDGVLEKKDGALGRNWLLTSEFHVSAFGPVDVE
jgi:hypothetical protein